MGLISKTAIVKWAGSNRKWYESKGYIFTKCKDEFEVKVEDLSKGANTYVNVECDGCKKLIDKPILWCGYKRGIDRQKGYFCFSCTSKLNGEKRRKTMLQKTLYDWCIENNRQEILDRWDYKLNKLTPKDISYSTNIKYYFKCPKEIHPSELKVINDFTRGQEGSIQCVACNSIGQYIIDTYGKNGLDVYWDYKKNNELGLDPWIISYGSNKKIWIFCQDNIRKYYHKSYDIACHNFIKGNRCPFCNPQSGKVHPLDSLGYYIIDKYGAEFLHNIWSEKNKKSPFEYTPNSNKEVYWKCFDGIHKDYYRSIVHSNIAKFRCPECVQERSESIIEEKTRLYLESLQYEQLLHEYNCNLVPINPKTKQKLLFDNEITLKNGKSLICEVNGIQHYEELIPNSTWLSGKTPKEYLHYRKLKDRYKRFISYINGYEYLELPYIYFDKKDTYKKLINNKINEILTNQ